MGRVGIEILETRFLAQPPEQSLAKGTCTSHLACPKLPEKAKEQSVSPLSHHISHQHLPELLEAGGPAPTHAHDRKDVKCVASLKS